jgi:hypothetical protein
MPPRDTANQIRKLRAEQGAIDQFAQQQSRAAEVSCGSKADIEARPFDVRFTPESGHCRATIGCPLCAKSGLALQQYAARIFINRFVQLIRRRNTS